MAWAFSGGMSVMPRARVSLMALRTTSLRPSTLAITGEGRERRTPWRYMASRQVTACSGKG